MFNIKDDEEKSLSEAGKRKPSQAEQIAVRPSTDGEKSVDEGCMEETEEDNDNNAVNDVSEI